MYRTRLYYRQRLGKLSENGTVCGIKLPDGLQESQQLPEPIFTPSTKAELGDHDENVSFEESIDVLEKPFPVKAVNMPKRFGTTRLPCIKMCRLRSYSRHYHCRYEVWIRYWWRRPGSLGWWNVDSRQFSFLAVGRLCSRKISTVLRQAICSRLVIG